MKSTREDVYLELNTLYVMLHRLIISLYLESRVKAFPKKKMFAQVRLISTLNIARYDDLIKKLFILISSQNQILKELNKKDEKINLKEIKNE